jgi:hypothetical protein
MWQTIKSFRKIHQNDENNHPSIDRIRKNAPKNNIDFDFKPTNTDTITKLVNKINIKKATGVDQISCKLLKAGSPVLNKHLTTLLNNTIKHSQFPLAFVCCKLLFLILCSYMGLSFFWGSGV